MLSSGCNEKFLLSRHHIPTDCVALHINPHTTHNSSNRSDKGLTLESSALYSLRWPIYVFISVVNTKLPINKNIYTYKLNEKLI